MKARLTLLRILVLVGCLPLVVRQAGMVTVGATSQTCTNFGSKTTPNCPSGCTSGTYITYPLLGGKGFYDATQVTSPCSPSTCAQPTAYSAPTLSQCGQQPCCLANLTKPCSSTECGNADPCCAPSKCINGACCYPNGTGCSSNTQCCMGLCSASLCYQSGIGESCTSNYDCCGQSTICSTSKTCCETVGGFCSANTDCCSNNCVLGTCQHAGSPIIIDVDGSGFNLTDYAGGVKFDLFDLGQPTQISWTAPGSTNAFLALDRNGDGRINDGAELFGDVTPQPPSDEPMAFWRWRYSTSRKMAVTETASSTAATRSTPSFVCGSTPTTTASLNRTSFTGFRNSVLIGSLWTINCRIEWTNTATASVTEQRLTKTIPTLSVLTVGPGTCSCSPLLPLPGMGQRTRTCFKPSVGNAELPGWAKLREVVAGRRVSSAAVLRPTNLRKHRREYAP